jgi:hypothetical protein
MALWWKRAYLDIHVIQEDLIYGRKNIIYCCHCCVWNVSEMSTDYAAVLRWITLFCTMPSEQRRYAGIRGKKNEIAR